MRAYHLYKLVKHVESEMNIILVALTGVLCDSQRASEAGENRVWWHQGQGPRGAGGANVCPVPGDLIQIYWKLIEPT